MVHTVGPCCPTPGPHLDLMVIGPAVGQNKALCWEHNNILTFLTGQFFCQLCKQNTPALAKTITIALIFTGFCLHSKYPKSIKRA